MKEAEALMSMWRIFDMARRRGEQTTPAQRKVMLREIRNLADAGMSAGGERQITIGRWHWRQWNSYRIGRARAAYRRLRSLVLG